MNSKTIFSLFLASSFVLVSCKKELEPQESSPTTAEVTPESQTPIVNPVATVPPTPQNNTSVSPSPRTATPVAVAKGMNPSHGQPGHRCDIPVGAPLSSPPGNKTTPQPATTNTISSNPTSGTPALLQPPVVTAEGMNPPHGQDGHQCGIPVGNPLPKP